MPCILVRHRFQDRCQSMEGYLSIIFQVSWLKRTCRRPRLRLKSGESVGTLSRSTWGTPGSSHLERSHSEVCWLCSEMPSPRVPEKVPVLVRWPLLVHCPAAPPPCCRVASSNNYSVDFQTNEWKLPWLAPAWPTIPRSIVWVLKPLPPAATSPKLNCGGWSGSSMVAVPSTVQVRLYKPPRDAPEDSADSSW